MKKNQKGFSAVELVLFAVIVSLIGFVGWYVYSSQKKTSDTLDNAANNSTVVNTKKNDSKVTSNVIKGPQDIFSLDILDWNSGVAYQQECKQVPSYDESRMGECLGGNSFAPKDFKYEYPEIYQWGYGVFKSNLTPEQWSKDGVNIPDSAKVEQRTIKVNGYDAYYIKSHSNESEQSSSGKTYENKQTGIHYVVSHNGYIVYLEGSQEVTVANGNYFDFSKNVPDFKKIVNSIKFLK